MNFLRKLGKRIFSYTIDAYLVFRVKLDDDTGAGEGHQLLPRGYSTRAVVSEADEAFPQICDMWQAAYYQGAGTSRNAIDGIVKKMFEDGDVCCCLFYEGNLAGMDWVGFSRATRRLHFAHYVKNEPSVSIGHHMFISIPHRGMGLQRETDILRKKVAREKGAVVQYVFVGVKNFASARNMMKCHQQYRLLHHARIDIPFLSFNLYPGDKAECWLPCTVR